MRAHLSALFEAPGDRQRVSEGGSPGVPAAAGMGGGSFVSPALQAVMVQLQPVIDAEVERYRALWRVQQLPKLCKRDHDTWHE